MPYGLFDYTPDDTIHTMGLSPTAVPGEAPPQLPLGWTDPYGSNENKPGTFPEPPMVTGYQQNVGENPYTRGPACEQTGNCNPNPPVSTLAIPENPADLQPQPPQSQSIGQGSPNPPLPGGVRSPDYGNPYTLAIPEDAPGTPIPLPTPPGTPTPKIMAENPPQGTPGTPGNPYTLAIPEDAPGTPIPLPTPPLVTKAMICSENIAACPKPPPLGPVTLAIPENPATSPQKPRRQWSGFTNDARLRISPYRRIIRVTGEFLSHLQPGNPMGGTRIIAGAKVLIVYPTFQQALDDLRKRR